MIRLYYDLSQGWKRKKGNGFYIFILSVNQSLANSSVSYNITPLEVHFTCISLFYSIPSNPNTRGIGIITIVPYLFGAILNEGNTMYFGEIRICFRSIRIRRWSGWGRGREKKYMHLNSSKKYMHLNEYRRITWQEICEILFLIPLTARNSLSTCSVASCSADCLLDSPLELQIDVG